MRRFRWILLVIALGLVACGTDDVSEEASGPEALDPSDLEVVPDIDSKGDEILPTFDANFVVDDHLYTDSDYITASDLQTFFESSPYHSRSWLADAEFDGRSAADIIVAVSEEFEINPLMLLVRLQVEQGLVSKTERPSERRINRALGCGCADGQHCASRFLGFENQMRCGAETHRKLFDQSADGTGSWRSGRTKSTLDRVRVTPQNHSTAALYGYTPWVLRGRGGNWLVWNIARKFTRHMEDKGLIVATVPAWIGTPCSTDDECTFSANGESAFCLDFQTLQGELVGFCTIVCEGTCPDRAQAATTFCIAADVPNVGVCAAQAVDLNNQCADIPGTIIEERDRFVGASGASPRTSLVCAPDVQ